jgi:hypothetical protein
MASIAASLPEAIALSLPPSTECIVHPEGTSSDETQYRVTARADGEARFSLEPALVGRWGSRLALECTLGGSPQGHYVIDLADRSTFIAKEHKDLEPKRIGTRPALTGDLSALSRSDLLRDGYPPRPDANRQPESYAKWLNAVTRPTDIYDTVPITGLGERATGAYDGSFSLYGTTGTIWTGFVQSAGGFQNEPQNENYPFALYGAFYEDYLAQMYAPYSSCSEGGCSASFQWMGIGGWPAELFGQVNPDLLQSGFETIYYGNGPEVYLFGEWLSQSDFAPPDKWLPPGNDKYSSGDEFWVIGVAGDSNCNPKSPPTKGCFTFEDLTNNWVQQGSVGAPSDSVWWPVTAEYIAERNGPGMNGDFFLNEMIGEAQDTNGNDHWDPGNVTASDPYIVTTQIDQSGNPCAIAEWNNGTVNTTPNTSADPMWLIWHSCGPN